MNYTLEEIAELCGGKLHSDSDKSRRFTRIDSDSRKITDPQTLFAALRGDSFDGHAFAAELCVRGGAIVDDSGFFCPNSILTDNVKAALYRLALAHRSRQLPALKVLAVTGSVGKTTVKNMAALVMGAQYKTYKSAGNRNSLTGLPMEVLNIPADTEWAVLEAGMSEPGEIAEISRLIKPSAAIITNIGHSHILAFGSREAICTEKLSVTAGMERSLLIAPNEPLIKSRAAVADEVIYCGNGCEAYVEDIKQIGGKTEFTACYGGEKTHIVLPAVGMHNVNNALLCFTAGVRLGVAADRAASAIGEFVAEGNRQSIRHTGGIKVIADCYNASPESMSAALSVLGESGGKRIAVLGDMLELGDHSERLHRLVGERAASSADVIICVGSEAMHTAAAAREAGFDENRLFTYPSEEYVAAAQKLLSIVHTGDTVLFKASNRTNIKKVMEVSGL